MHQLAAAMLYRLQNKLLVAATRSLSERSMVSLKLLRNGSSHWKGALNKERLHCRTLVWMSRMQKREVAVLCHSARGWLASPYCAAGGNAMRHPKGSLHQLHKAHGMHHRNAQQSLGDKKRKSLEGDITVVLVQVRILKSKTVQSTSESKRVS